MKELFDIIVIRTSVRDYICAVLFIIALLTLCGIAEFLNTLS